MQAWAQISSAEATDHNRYWRSH